MAESLERHVKNLETAEKNLLNRTFQQTVCRRARTICADQQRPGGAAESNRHARGANTGRGILRVFVQLPAGQLRLQAGVGWKPEYDRQTSLPGNENSPIVSALKSGDPVITADLKTESRNLCVAVSGRTRCRQRCHRRHSHSRPALWNAGHLQHAPAEIQFG